MAKRSVDKNLEAAAAFLGRKGGPARAQSLTKKRRIEIAKEGGHARQAQRKETHHDASGKAV